MSVLRRVKLRTPDGIESIEYPLGVDAENVEVANGENLSQRLARIDEDLEKNEEDIAAVSELAGTNKQNIGANEIRIDALERRSASVDKKPYYFNTVADMKAYQKLIEGDMAITLGYYEANDGGKALYKIRNKNNNDIINNSTIIEINQILIAELIIFPTISASAFGFLPNNPDSTILNNAFNYMHKLILKKGRYVLTNGNINIPSNCELDINGSSIYGTIVFDGSLQGKLKNGFIYGNPCVKFENNRVGDSVLENLELISSNGKAFIINCDTGNNIFNHVKFQSSSNDPAVHLIGSQLYPINYLHFNECSFTGKIGILIDKATNYLWIKNCDIISKYGIQQNVNCENFFITENSFFPTIEDSIGYYMPDETKRLWNLSMTNNLFSRTSNINCKAIKINGNLSYSKLDNMFYNFVNGYDIANHTSVYFGKTLSAITGSIINNIERNASSSAINLSTSVTYNGAGSYELSLPISAIPYQPNIIVSGQNITSFNNIRFENNRAYVNFTLSSAGTVTILAV